MILFSPKMEKSSFHFNPEHVLFLTLQAIRFRSCPGSDPRLSGLVLLFASSGAFATALLNCETGSCAASRGRVRSCSIREQKRNVKLPPDPRLFQRIVQRAFLIRTLCRPNFTFRQSAGQKPRRRDSRGCDALQPEWCRSVAAEKETSQTLKAIHHFHCSGPAASVGGLAGSLQGGPLVFVLTWSFVNILLEDDSISHVFMNFERTVQSASSLSLGDFSFLFFFLYFWAEFEFKSSGFELEKKKSMIWRIDDDLKQKKKVFVKISLLVVWLF